MKIPRCRKSHRIQLAGDWIKATYEEWDIFWICMTCGELFSRQGKRLMKKIHESLEKSAKE